MQNNQKDIYTEKAKKELQYLVEENDPDYDKCISDYARTLKLIDKYKEDFDENNFDQKQWWKSLIDSREIIYDTETPDDEKKKKLIPDNDIMIAINSHLAQKHGLDFPKETGQLFGKALSFFQSTFDTKLENEIEKKLKKDFEEIEYNKQIAKEKEAAIEKERKAYSDLGINLNDLKVGDKTIRERTVFIENAANKSTWTGNKEIKNNMNKCFTEGNLNKQNLKNSISLYIYAKMVQENRPKPKGWQIFTKWARNNETKLLDDWKNKLINTGAVNEIELNAYNRLSDAYFNRKVDATKLDGPDNNLANDIEKEKDLKEVRKTLNAVDMNKLKLDTNSELGKETSEMKINDPNTVKQKEIGKN